MIPCDLCPKTFNTPRELEVHKKYFHGVVQNGQHMVMSAPSGQRMVGGVCPECGSTLYHEEGCLNCKACGYSKCS